MEIDGVVCGKIKYRQTSYTDIDRFDVGAHIEPFAQKEMVERFLDGIDPDFVQYIRGSMDETLTDFGNELIDQFSKASKAKRSSSKALVATAIERYLDKFMNAAEERRRVEFRQKVLDMVHYMPKSDLATMAESLVSLTSIKRRVSAETETVGGPVDVAVITKGDGFVWIKRKHYFDLTFNPRYVSDQRRRRGKDDDENA